MKPPLKTRVLYAWLLIAAVAYAGTLVSCTSGIPLFDKQARPLNRVASAEELLAENYLLIAQLRDDGLITQEFINKSLAPDLNKAEQILMSTRAILRGAATSQPTTQPAGTLEDARRTLENVRKILLQIQRSKP